jgi:RimJ/RimL family protein N-acetyltransferase
VGQQGGAEMKLIPFKDVFGNEVDSWLDKIADERNSEEIFKYLRSSKVTLPNEQWTWKSKTNYDPSCKYFFIIEETGGERICIGYCGLDKIDSNRSAEISIMIFREFQKRGYGRHVINELVKYGAKELDLNCMYAESYLYPEREQFIINFWRSLGFKMEGILRKRKLWQGIYYDSGVFSIIKGDGTI